MTEHHEAISAMQVSDEDIVRATEALFASGQGLLMPMS